MINRILSLVTHLTFTASAVIPSSVYAQALNLPAPGTMVLSSPAYIPVMMKGIKVHPENPLLLDFILDSGKSGLNVNVPEFKVESQKSIKYFLTALTVKSEAKGCYGFRHATGWY